MNDYPEFTSMQRSFESRGGAMLNLSAEPEPFVRRMGLIPYASLTELLSVSRPTLDRYAKEDAFPRRTRIGRSFYVSQKGLEDWLTTRASTDLEAD